MSFVHAPLLAGLRRHLETTEGGAVEVIETHISWVLLTPRHAYKLKKPVKLGFVDFSSLAARHQACEDELRLNRRMAAELYLGVLPVYGPSTQPSLVGSGEVIDWVVQMQRFDAGALWSERLAHGELLARHIDLFAQRLARFHAEAPRASATDGWGTAEACAAPALHALAAIEAMQPEADVTALRQWLHEQADALAATWVHRKAQGFVRECHGDLHLANLVVLGESNEGVTAFDCLEFSASLRWIDVLSDVAFLAMDLWAHGRRDLAFRFLNAYLEHSGDYAGLPVLRHGMVHRALVRSQVNALVRTQVNALVRTQVSKLQRAGSEQPDYLALAQAITQSADPRLLLTSGLPGSGKSHVSQRLLEATGAIRIRSDVERKRLHGLSALADSRSSGADIYTPEATEKTFAQLRQLTRCTLQAGYPTIADAASLKRAERERFSALAQELAVPFNLLVCDAPATLLRQRVKDRAARQIDASEAGLAVLERLSALREPLSSDEETLALRVDTRDEIDATALATKWVTRTSQTPAPHR